MNIYFVDTCKVIIGLADAGHCTGDGTKLLKINLGEYFFKEGNFNFVNSIFHSQILLLLLLCPPNPLLFVL